MATIGHTLAGLSLGGLSGAKSRKGAMPYIWLGVMVLSSHLIDLVEWGVTLVAPSKSSQHSLTHSPWLVLAVAGAVCIGMAVFGKVRSPLPFVLAIVAVFSHLLLDYNPERAWLLRIYGFDPAEVDSNLRNSIVAEIWFFGLALALVMLVQAARRRDCPPMGRRAAVVLGALAVAAAATRWAALWLPAYCLAGLHALLLFRREWSPRFAWSLVPLIPLVALVAVEMYANALYREAVELQEQHDYASAIALHKRTLAVPTRSPKVGTYVYLAGCYLYTGDLANCERCLLTAERIAEFPAWPMMTLAHTYVSDAVRGTAYFRPEESARIFRSIIDGPWPEKTKDLARGAYESYRRQGLFK